MPAGKQARSASNAVRSGVEPSDHRRHDVHDVAVALDRHELDDLDGARRAHPAEVVAAEVDQHQVLGPLLGVGEQLGAERGVLLRGRAARAGAGDRVQQRRVALSP